MAQKKWIIGIAAFLVVSLMFSGIAAWAIDANSDPIPTLSYIEQEFSSSLMQKIDTSVANAATNYTSDLDAKYNRLAADLQAQVTAMGGGDSSALAADADFVNAVAAAVLAQMPASTGGTGDGSGVFKRVDMKSGKTITFDLGAEVVIRLGTATVVASGSPGLIDLTTGGDLAAGAELVKNHHYICTVAGRGLKSNSEITIFVRGSYTES